MDNGAASPNKEITEGDEDTRPLFWMSRGIIYEHHFAEGQGLSGQLRAMTMRIESDCGRTKGGNI